ncbi:MAG: adenosine deaminase [Candidatus Eremiobacteraeota bacterium]|nr:adenosine deaminase [Candidatus Eremiobacteraeota bacterium]
MGANTLAARIPKIHLHCHLEGSLRAPTFVELAGKHGVPLRYKSDDTAVDRDDPYRFETFEEFLYIFAAVSRSLHDPQDYARLAREFVEDALAQNVIYGELFISPSVWTFFNPQLDVRETMEAIAGELRNARPQADFKLLPDLTRNFGALRAMETVRAMAAMTDLDVIGISLGGDEIRFPAGLFIDAFGYARSEGLHCVAHAGEAAGAASVRDAVELLGAERIGHGFRALEDPSVVDLLAERGIAVEICPSSNRLTRSELPDYPHPYIDMDRSGCVVTIDGDDPTIFRTSIAQEYALVEEAAGADALERFVRNAIGASFAAAEAKRAMEARLDAAVAELRAAPRS